MAPFGSNSPRANVALASLKIQQTVVFQEINYPYDILEYAIKSMSFGWLGFLSYRLDTKMMELPEARYRDCLLWRESLALYTFLVFSLMWLGIRVWEGAQMLSLEVSSVSVWLGIFEHLTCTGLGFSISSGREMSFLPFLSW